MESDSRNTCNFTLIFVIWIWTKSNGLIKVLNDKYSKLDIKYEILLKSYNDLEKDYNALVRNTEASNLIFQEKCNNRILITDQKVEVLQKDLSRYDDFLKAFNFDDKTNIIEMIQKSFIWNNSGNRAKLE
jgi:hypothetical protein